MEFKYKVGDRVKILDGSKIGGYTASWARGMVEYVGKTTTVLARKPYGGRASYDLADAGGYIYDERGLAPVSSDRIVIYTDKKDPSKVVAKDVSTGKTGVAKCSPEDIFDFYTGAKLAMERLLGVEKVGADKPSDPKSKFPVGQLVIGNEGANRYSITKEKTVWKVTAVRQNGSIGISGPKADIVGGFEVRPDRFDLYTGTLPTFKAFCTESKNGWQKGKIYSIIDGKCINDKRYNPCYCISAEQMSDVIGVEFIRVME